MCGCGKKVKVEDLKVTTSDVQNHQATATKEPVVTVKTGYHLVKSTK